MRKQQETSLLDVRAVQTVTESIRSVGFPIVMCIILTYLVFETIPDSIDKVIAEIKNINSVILSNQTIIVQNQKEILAILQDMKTR